MNFSSAPLNRMPKITVPAEAANAAREARWSEALLYLHDQADCTRDYFLLKAVCLAALHRTSEAAEALECELKAFPDNDEARRLLDCILCSEKNN